MEECRNRQREIDTLQSLCKSKSDDYTTHIYNNRIHQLTDEIAGLMAEKEALDKAVAKLTTVEKRILILRYLDKKSWDYINVMTGYSRRQCFRIHNYSVERLFNLNYK